MTTVTRLTHDATLDDLSASDYRDIYDELRGRYPATGVYAISLDKFVMLVTSAYSKALWSQYHNGQTTLNRNQRNELRRAVGLLPLPPTVAEVTATASPDAAVWQVGEGVADRIVMVATDTAITVHVNGSVTADANAMQDSHVTEVTRARRDRRVLIRPVATPAQESRRLAISATWKEVIETGLLAIERIPK